MNCVKYVYSVIFSLKFVGNYCLHTLRDSRRAVRIQNLCEYFEKISFLALKH
jgi:hypothetical protein